MTFHRRERNRTHHRLGHTCFCNLLVDIRHRRLVDITNLNVNGALVGTHDGHINPAKCVFVVREATALGYTVSAEGTRPLEEKCGRVFSEIMQWASKFCRINNAFIIVVRAADTYETLVST
jgi:hypothetical protein